jgi:sugar phosphate isomerase/epimerase
MIETNRPRLSLAPLTLLGLPPTELIDAAVAGGFDSVAMHFFAAPGHAGRITRIAQQPALVCEIERRLRDAGITVLDTEAVILDEETDIAGLAPTLEIAARLGAEYLLVAGNVGDAARMEDKFSEVCELASTFRIRVVLEFVPYWRRITTLALAADLIARTGTTAGILVDTLHLARSGGTPADIAQYDASLFPYVHLCDARAIAPPFDDLRRESREARRFPGEGELDMMAFLDAFPLGTPLAVEAPCDLYADLPAFERARRCGDATRATVDRYYATKLGRF